MNNKSDEFELEIDNLAYGGSGIGRIDNFVVFVPDTVPGDKVLVKISSQKKNFATASLLKILSPSEQRVQPFCEHAQSCGGCQWQHVSYPFQLEIKRQILSQNLMKIAALSADVRPSLSLSNIAKYRYKAAIPVGQSKNSSLPSIGYFKKGSYIPVQIDSCPVMPDSLNTILASVKEHILKYSIKGYNKKKGSGFLQQIILRAGHRENEAVLVFSVNGYINKNFTKACHDIFDKNENLAGIIADFKRGMCSKQGCSIHQSRQIMAGRDYIFETIADKRFRISSGSFFQINPFAAEVLFNEVRQIIRRNLDDKAVILDIYSGIGNFPIILSDYASHITAIEENGSAVDDAVFNIENAGLTDKITMIKGSAEKVLSQMDKSAVFDAVILDPPRKGSSEIVLDKISQMAKKLIIYISCNPATLCRDLKLLNEKGFDLKYIQPLDMFPHTYHIESISVLETSTYR